MGADILARPIARTRRRLVPFLLLMYIVAFLDRANIGFAKQVFQASTGVSDSEYALGAGLFFVGYALFGIPGNLIMQRVGARVWMCRIMVAWGLASAGMMFVRGTVSFYVVRLLLGSAEAGFFPGIILYLTYWFPNRVRGQILGLFYFGAPLAFILGGPLSGILLEMPARGGLLSWQWMFLAEGSLAVIAGLAAFWYLVDKPADAPWLRNAEGAALQAALAREERERRTHGPSAFLPALKDPKLLHFAAIYFLIQMSVYGVVFYLPTEVAAIMGKPVGPEVGLVAAIPWICALAATFWLPRLADRSKRHRMIAVVILLVSGVASALFVAPGAVVALASMCVAASGFIAVQPIFWTFPTNYLSGRAAAGGIATINAVGCLGGFVAPSVKVWADNRFGFHAGLYVLAGFTLLTGGLIALQSPTERRA